MNNDPIRPNNSDSGESFLSRRGLLIGSIGAAAAATAAILEGCSKDGQAGVLTDKTKTELDSTSTVPNQSEVCSLAFEVKGVDHGDRNRWFAEGIPSIKTASTPEEARNALGDWLYGTNEHPGIKDDPQLTTAVYNITKPADVESITAEGMVDDSKCATPKMVDAITNIEAWLAFADVTPGTAPVNGINTGTNSEGIVTVASKAGVYGDDESRKAVVVSLKDGTAIYVMCRCGQPVLMHPSKGNLPTGPTEETHEQVPEKPKTPEETTSTTTTEPGKEPKYDDDRLPGNSNIPADQDRGDPSNAEPQAPPTTKEPDETPQAPTTTGRPPATTTPPPETTNPPVTATTSAPTTAPQNQPRPTQP